MGKLVALITLHGPPVVFLVPSETNLCPVRPKRFRLYTTGGMVMRSAQELL